MPDTRQSAWHREVQEYWELIEDEEHESARALELREFLNKVLPAGDLRLMDTRISQLPFLRSVKKGITIEGREMTDVKFSEEKFRTALHSIGRALVVGSDHQLSFSEGAIWFLNDLLIQLDIDRKTFLDGFINTRIQKMWGVIQERADVSGYIYRVSKEDNMSLRIVVCDFNAVTKEGNIRLDYPAAIKSGVERLPPGNKIVLTDGEVWKVATLLPDLEAKLCE